MECKKNDCFNCPYPDCINDYVKKTYPRKKQWIAHQTEYVSKRAKRRAAEGLCTKCGKRPPRPEYRTCGECAMKSRRASNEHKWRNGTTPKVLMDGVTLCKKCGKNPPVTGYAVCERCLALCRKALDKTPSHNGKAPDNGFARALRADYLLNKKEKK